MDRAAEQLLELAPRLKCIIAAAARADDSASALTMTQLRALDRLAQGLRLPSELAREMEITPATASEVVDLLVRRGLVERREHPGDRRQTPLAVTADGMACWEAANERAVQALTQLLTGMAPARRTALEDGLETLLELIDGRSRAGGGSEDEG